MKTHKKKTSKKPSPKPRKARTPKPTPIQQEISQEALVSSQWSGSDLLLEMVELWASQASPEAKRALLQSIILRLT